MNVPFVDLRAQHHALQHALSTAIQRVMDSGDFALGRDVTRFEQAFGSFCGVRHAVGVDSGLSALELSLRALGVGPGDEVILPANSFVATAAAVTFAGARPVLVDVDPATYNIDVAQVRAALTPRTRAVIPVHLYGLPADMEPILELAEERGLVVIEDACQAHGAWYRGRRVGSLGHAAAFSFYPTKNLGGCGDAGMVTTGDESVAEKVRAMRNCGQRHKYYHELPPFNHRLDTLQAAILCVKLPYLESWTAARQQSATLYTQMLMGEGIVTPIELPHSTHVFHLYVIRAPRRDAIQAHLRERGISTAIHYPVPIHLHPFYAGSGFYPGQFPVTEQLCTEVLSLPMFPEMTEEQVQYVADAVIEFGRGAGRAGPGMAQSAPRAPAGQVPVESGA